MKKQSTSDTYKSKTYPFDYPNQRYFDNACRTGCCWHILTAFIKLLRIIKWINFALRSFTLWMFLQLLLKNFFDSTSLSPSRSKIRIFWRDARSGLIVNPSLGGVHKLSGQARGRGGFVKCQHLSTKGEGDQGLVNVDKFELFIRLNNSNTKN